jgi:hypothetical protein
MLHFVSKCCQSIVSQRLMSFDQWSMERLRTWASSRSLGASAPGAALRSVGRNGPELPPDAWDSQPAWARAAGHRKRRATLERPFMPFRVLVRVGLIKAGVESKGLALVL